MVEWHRRRYGHEFEQAPGDDERQGRLLCCSPWGHKESDMTERLTHTSYFVLRASQVGGASGKEPTCSEGDLGSIPGLGRYPGEEMATPSIIVAWKIPWTEEPSGLQSMGSQE